LEAEARRAASSGVARATNPTLGAASGELVAKGTLSLNRVFKEVSSTVAGEAPSSHSALGAVGWELDVRGAVSLDGVLKEVSSTIAGEAPATRPASDAVARSSILWAQHH